MLFAEYLTNKVWVCLCGLFILSGCGTSGPQGGPRVSTTAVTGTVNVDGAPAAFLRVVAVSSGATSQVPIESSALTSADGKFSLSTYESGDGVPAGTYKLTFYWGEMNLMNGQYSGDKFKGRYADAAKSEVAITVNDGSDAQDVGVINLSMK